MEKRIAIIGLGYVGLPLAVAFAKHFNVVGFDIDQTRIIELQKFHDSTLEVDTKKIKSIIDKLNFTFDINDIKECNIYIITVPSPVNEINRPDLKPLINASKTVGSILNYNDIVIYESTVYPGATENICIPVLEKYSGMKFNEDFFCGYSPERINPGDKINRLENTIKITSGSTKEIAEKVDTLYKTIITAGTYKTASIKVAEAAKVIENAQRDLNIAFTNEISVIFQRLGIDTMEVLEAAGSKWNFLPFRPGLVGGHCIGVDPYYLTHVADQHNYFPELILAGRRINEKMSSFIVKEFIQKMIVNKINLTNSTVGIMGITFKENCPDVRNSKVIDIISQLKKWGVKVIIYDPWVNPLEIQKKYSIEVSATGMTKKVDSLLVAVGHQQFRSKTTKEIRMLCKGQNPVIADIKSIYNKNDLINEGFTVFRL